MKRRDFVQLTKAGIAGSLLSFPSFGNVVQVESLLQPFLPVTTKKQLADVALNMEIPPKLTTSFRGNVTTKS